MQGKKIHGHRYLYLDEPLTNLDINYQQEFLTIARSLTKTDTVLVAVMDDVNLAVQYADKLIFLKDGEMVSYGKPLEILSEQLLKMFLMLIRRSSITRLQVYL